MLVLTLHDWQLLQAPATSRAKALADLAMVQTVQTSSDQVLPAGSRSGPPAVSYKEAGGP